MRQSPRNPLKAWALALFGIAGPSGSGNVFDQQGSKPGQAEKVTKFGIKALPFSLNTASAPPQDFLRYPAASPLASAGELKQPVGATD